MGKKKKAESFQVWLADHEKAYGVGIEHGDYERIAKLCPKPEGGGYYTSDYVRKVMKDMRDSPEIAKKAKAYIRQKTKMVRGLKTPSKHVTEK